MRKQQNVWGIEHRTATQIPAMNETEPSSAVLDFMKWLKSKNIKTKNCTTIDIGCGKGRNAIYLAKKGLHVYAIDYIDYALEILKYRALQNKVHSRITTIHADIDKVWPFENNYFDFAIDNFSSIDIETKSGRKIYKKELLRTLKPNGFALVSVVSTQDEVERKLMITKPGKERNSSLWPDTNKFQKNYDEEELRSFYKNFKILELKKIHKTATKMNKTYIVENFWLILQKTVQ